MTLLYKLSSINKTYKQGDILVPAVKDVNLEINAGEFTALVGPSGSGKTTLLNLLGALDFPDSGSIQFETIELQTASEKERSQIRLHRMGFVFQAYNLLPVFTAYENVEYMLILQGAPEEGRRERCMEILEAVGLTEMAHRIPSQMSGGQQQRVAVARAMVGNPSVILADEPTANLDSRTASLLLDYMEKMNEQFKTTFIFSTHDNRVMERAKRVVEMIDGSMAE